MSSEQQPAPGTDAASLLDEAAADPSMDELMRRCPAGATEAELAASVAVWRRERAAWRARE
jgi:hypothetical protein